MSVVLLVANSGGTTTPTAVSEIRTAPSTSSESPADEPPTPRDWGATDDLTAPAMVFPYNGGQYVACEYSDGEPLFANSRSEVFCAGTATERDGTYFIIRWDDPQTAITAVRNRFPAATQTTWAHGPEFHREDATAFMTIRCYSGLPFCIIAVGANQNQVKTDLGHITVLSTSEVQALTYG
ncbi:MAG: hypothetical protein FWD11_07455 [Micrococcales bacterium]|nr:hypothetical protein [Micrococcales bacterium]